MSSLSAEQVHTIKATVPVLQRHGQEITARFYKDMLRDIPDLNDVFNQTNQSNGHQAAALAGSLYAYAAHIDDLGALSQVMERISQKHASLYVKPQQYEIVGNYLLQAMKKVLGEALTPNMQDAWAVAYQNLANLMINREAKLFEEAGDWKSWREFRITRKTRESAEITSFHLAPLDGKPLPSYLPGQYISIRTSVSNIQHLQARQYSLSDAPNPDFYRITIKKEQVLNIDDPDAKAHQGYISNILHNEKNIGDLIEVSHPAGEFFLVTRGEDSPIVLISAGVGLTPEMSMFNTLIAQKSKRRISWVHASRNSRVQAFADYIKKIADAHDNVQTHVFIKEPGEDDVADVDYQFTGRMNLSKLDANHDLFINDSKTEYYICGPERFMADMMKYLERQGVEGTRIKLEIFGTGESSKA